MALFFLQLAVFISGCSLALNGAPLASPVANTVPVDPLSLMDDEFLVDGSVGGVWSVFNPATAADNIDSGTLHLDPLNGSANSWFQNDEGIHIRQDLDGSLNFKITIVNVMTHKRDTPGVTTAGKYQMGGILVVSDVDMTDWHFVAVGTGGVNGVTVAEIKDTVDAVSVVDQTAWGSNQADLRMCKVGSEYRTYHRAASSSDAWILTETYTRADLDDIDLHAGIFCHDWSTGGLDADNVRCSFGSFQVQTIESGDSAGCLTDTD